MSSEPTQIPKIPTTLLNFPSPIFDFARQKYREGKFAQFSLWGKAVGGARDLSEDIERRGSIIVEDFGAQGIEVDLSGNSITRGYAEQLAVALGQDPSIATLRLASTHFDDDCAECFGGMLWKNTALTSLSLSRNEIGDAGVGHLAASLAKNSTLMTLQLNENQISSVGSGRLAGALAKNEKLTQLDLSANRIDDEGAAQFAELLEEHGFYLVWLGLSDNEISEEGALRLRAAVKSNPVLQVLNLGKFSMLRVEVETSLAFVDDESVRILQDDGGEVFALKFAQGGVGLRSFPDGRDLD